MIRRTHHALAALFLFGLGACGAAGDASRDGVVTNPAPDSDDIVQATEILRIGRTEGVGPDVFGGIAAIRVDSMDRMHVVDGMATEIRVFEADGEFVRRYGSEGEGPGEFLTISGLSFDARGFAWVWDLRQSRMSVFDTAGAFVRTVSRSTRTAVTPWPGQFTADGSVLDVVFGIGDLEPTEVRTQRFRSTVQAVRLDTAMQVIDSLPPLTFERTAFAGNFMVPFEGGLVWAFEPDGSSWSTHGPDYRVRRIDAVGDTLHEFTLDVPPVPVTAAERDSAVQNYRLPPGYPAMTADVLPEHKPGIVELIRLADGWVGVFPELGPETGRFMDVFSPEGEHRARVDMGSPLLLRPPPHAHDGRLVAVMTDVFDVQYLVVLDLGIPELGAAVASTP